MGDESGAELPVLTEPTDGLPEVVDTAQGRRTTLDALAAGSNQYADLEAAARADLEAHGWQVDYIEVRAARTLDIAHAGEHQLVVLAAARLGKTRLIDNIEVQR